MVDTSHLRCDSFRLSVRPVRKFDPSKRTLKTYRRNFADVRRFSLEGNDFTKQDKMSFFQTILYLMMP